MTYKQMQAMKNRLLNKKENEFEEEITMDNNELNLNELEEVTGGKQHFSPEPDRPGWIQHKVTASDTLIRIAKKYGISDWRKIREWNPHINHKTNMIINGEYLWIKQ